jgi:hypothetical protein
MGTRETAAPSYIKFPYDLFLMLRLEFLAITRDELEAKILRIIEKAINDDWERIYRENSEKTPKGKEVPMPDEVWVRIPYRYFMDRLFGTVQSESTLKEAMKSLVREKKLVLRRETPGRYDAPEYTLNKNLLERFFSMLPPNPRKLDIMGTMKHARKNGKSATPIEGQLSAPLITDILDQEGADFYPPQLSAPPEPIIDPLVEHTGGRLSDPTNISLDNNLNKSNAQSANASAHAPHFQEEEMITLLQQKGYQVTPPVDETSAQPPPSPPKGTTDEMPSHEPDTSYSQERPDNVTPITQARKKKNEGETMTGRIRSIYQTITKTKARLYQDDDYVEIENDTSTRAIKKLIEGGGTHPLLEGVIEDMWNEQGNDGSFFWRDRRRMTPKAICGQYANRASAIRTKLAKKTTSPPPPPDKPKRSLFGPNLNSKKPAEVM